MVNISMKAMLEAGVHFGHQTRRWNPKMGRYIFGERNNIHIIDLQKTVKELKKAYGFIKDKAAENALFLFVGTKKQAQEILKTEAQRCGVPYVSEKWLGGTLTNFSTLHKSLQRLEELERWETDGVFKVMSKKEVSRLSKEMGRLRKLLTGIRTLNKLPDIMFVIDPIEELLAVTEARKLKIPIVAICDTNCDPDLIDYPIPGNDDAARSVKLFCGLIADAVIEGRELYQKSKGTGASAGQEAASETEEAVVEANASEEVEAEVQDDEASSAALNESVEAQAETHKA